MIKRLRAVIFVGLGALIGIVFFFVRPSAHALPEYATRTGQQCATCHVNPAGGGPRTLRGLLWIAEGRPDEVPPLPGAEEEAAAGEGGLDGESFYTKFECSLCHGAVGEGNVGPALNQAEIPADTISDVIRNGTGAMQGYRSDKMSDEEMDALILYVQSIGRGEVQADAGLERQAVRPAKLRCGAKPPSSPRTDCGGN